jgi:hypothetical protein
VLRQQGGVSFVFNTLLGAQATMGETLNTLPNGLIGRVDYSTSIDVKLNFGALSSITRAELLAGANTAAIGDAMSGYEIIQFETAELIAGNTYRLRGLLRAQAGSYAETLASRSSGQRFVLLNGAVSQAVVSLPEAGLPSTWRMGPATLDHGHAAYVQISVPPTLKALRPLRPAQLRVRPAVGGVLITWIRQTRNGGDAWEFENVPLSEDVENYVLQVLSGATVLRSWTPSESQQLYTTVEIISDFGTPPATLSLKVAQVSAAFGAGTYLEGIVNV